jgi:type II secretory pathway pseudopilin PulG
MRKFNRSRVATPATDGRHVRSPDAGDTLVELLVAITIISICVVGLIGGLAAAVGSSGNHRSLTTLDAAIKSFAEQARYEVQLQPASGGAGPVFTRCTSTYVLAAAPNPSSGPVGTAVTVFGSGFTGSQNSVSIDGTPLPNPAPLTFTNSTYGNVTANFQIPALPTGPHTITINGGGTANTSTPFTVTPWLGSLSPASGPSPSSAPVTLPIRGFHQNTQIFVTVGSSSRVFAGTTNSRGSASLNFAIPTGLSSGPQSVSIFEGTNPSPTRQSSFTVATTQGLAGVADIVVTSSPLALYQVGIGDITYWDGTSFRLKTPAQCQSTSGPDQDMQQITVNGTAPGATDSLNTVVSNPQFVPTPTISIASSPSNPVVGDQLEFDATVTGVSGYGTPGLNPTTGTFDANGVSWQIAVCTPQSNGCIPQAAPNCTTTSVAAGTAPLTTVWTCILSGPELTASNYTVTAIYNGNPLIVNNQPQYQYNAVSSTTPPVGVGKGQLTISVPVPPTPTYGQPVTFTATVGAPNGPTPQGAVTWSVSGPGVNTPPCTGASSTQLPTTAPYQVTCTISSVAVGNYTVTATVAGDANWNGATSSPVTQVTVNPLPTTITVSSSPPPLFVGDTITFTATVTGQGSPPLTGQLSWSGVPCISPPPPFNPATGKSTCTVLATTAGPYNATATYGNDPVYASVTGATSAQASKATPPVSVSPALANGTLTFTATVAGPAGTATPTGTGTWNIAGPGNPGCNGGTTGLTGTGNPQGTATATCAISQAKAGSYTASYTYPGDSNYNSSSGSTPYAVPKANPTTGITATVHDGTVTFQATVAGPVGGPTPTGTPTWMVTAPGVPGCSAPTALTAVNPQGTATATCTISNYPPAGDYTVSFTYNGDANYNTVTSATSTFHVPTFKLSSLLQGNGNTRSLVFTATLTIPAGGQAPNGTVSWTVSGASCAAGTLSGSGTTYTAACTIPNSNGNKYNATASFMGDTYYLPADDTQTNVSG